MYIILSESWERLLMELSQKLQELRKQKNLTQEELAEILFVSRTAISKWESGRGYPSIDSLKAIAGYFSITIDELISGQELLVAAEKDTHQKLHHLHDIVFGMLDCAVAMFLFLPLFGQKVGNLIYEVTLFNLTETFWYIKIPYILFTVATILCGIATLALQNYTGAFWVKSKRVISLSLSVCSCSLFMISLQPYAAMLAFLFLLIKGILLLKRQ
ncbi:MAG: helix-turn-helix domain-containing protein [Gemmiger sp.]|nr:helix-turn-helix domain-containing protein [Gemmiger sp.]